MKRARMLREWNADLFLEDGVKNKVQHVLKTCGMDNHKKDD